MIGIITGTSLQGPCGRLAVTKTSSRGRMGRPEFFRFGRKPNRNSEIMYIIIAIIMYQTTPAAMTLHSHVMCPAHSIPLPGVVPALCCSCLPALCAYKCSHACGLGPKFLIQEPSIGTKPRILDVADILLCTLAPGRSLLSSIV